MSNPSNRTSMRGQLTLRGVVIGVLGCVINHGKLGLYRPQDGRTPLADHFRCRHFAVLPEAHGQRQPQRGQRHPHHHVREAMVAGGTAFTIPGAWMLGYADRSTGSTCLSWRSPAPSWAFWRQQLIHRHFIVDAALEFPTGNAAARTLRATEAGGKAGKQLFGSMAIAGIYSVLRDALGVVPSMLCTLNIPGVTFAIYNSPMLLSIGFWWASPPSPSGLPARCWATLASSLAAPLPACSIL